MKHSIISLAIALTGAMFHPAAAQARPDPSGAADDLLRLHVGVDRGVLPADTIEKAIIKIGIHGLHPSDRRLRPPVNIALVIDKSGSMSGEKIAKAREAALEAVGRLAPDDIVSLITYDTGVRTLVPAQRVGDGRRLRDAICEIEAGGNTALYGGVTRGAAEVRKHLEDDRYVNRIILLSDGLANVGPSSPEELGRLGASLVKEGISVTTIGLGLGFNEDLMTRLALRSDGNTYFVEHSSDLPRIFAAELGAVLSVVARRIIIEIEFPDNVRPLCFIGREGVIRGRKAELTLNQLYGGQERFALIEVEVAPANHGAECEIARARITYENALNQRSATLTASRRVQFSTRRAAVVGSADHRVQSDYAVNVMAVARDEAVALVDSNRRDAAAAQLRARAEELRRIGETYSNSAVSEMAKVVAPMADKVEKEGLSNVERKAYRAESTQVRTQQSGSR
jgi:Ca-activated chloride channel homolog